jgi:hypothetical protein
MPSAASPQTARRKGPIIRQADHLLVESGDPKTLFDFFAGTLLLPEAWPLSDNQGFTSGGVGAGNVNIEFFRYTEQRKSSVRKAAKARFAGIAFEPYPLSNSLRELQVEGIPYDVPASYTGTLPKGAQGVLWTTVALPTLSRPGMSIFLYEYSPEYLKVDIRRRQLGNRLLLNGGGPLGIQAVSQIVIATRNLEKDRSVWRKLLGAPGPSGTWHVGAGPVIRLIQGVEDRIQGIVFKVESLEQAQKHLKEKRILGSVSSKELLLNHLKVQGLTIRLQE